MGLIPSLRTWGLLTKLVSLPKGETKRKKKGFFLIEKVFHYIKRCTWCKLKIYLLFVQQCTNQAYGYLDFHSHTPKTLCFFKASFGNLYAQWFLKHCFLNCSILWYKTEADTFWTKFAADFGSSFTVQSICSSLEVSHGNDIEVLAMSRDHLLDLISKNKFGLCIVGFMAHNVILG